ncbi:MAG: hybrid sensor histidine kinase/response regulator [Sulfurovum sp.]|nr:MAG: hybrid sensor histidine kinase/response regulator [Sulfurovum sp.]
MQLHKMDKQKIIKDVTGLFDMEPAKAQHLVDNMEKALLGENKDFFYTLKYAIHFRNDTAFSRNVLKCAVENFSFLITKEEYASVKKELETFFYLFFETIFIQRCRYAKKIEKRGDTVQKVLQHMSNQLNKTLDTQQLMIANISHEMRTSLNAISGYLSIVKDKNILIGEDKNFLDKASSASSTLKALVSDILDVTKINSGQLEIKEEFFWLDKMILKCIDSIAIGLNKKNIIFKTKVDFFPKKVFGDRQHIMEIITNLLSNAVKYTDSGFVHLKVKKNQGLDDSIEILFQVEDSGIGMTQEQTENMFEPYSRFKTERQGVGLGLHIAYKLAQKLGGCLTAKSKFGEGSTFDFTVKLKEKPDNLIKTDNKMICFFNNTKETHDFKQKLHFLKEHGIEIVTFSNEQKFINYLLTLKDKAPDMISIVSDHEGYLKYDALINYLRTLKIFETTSFIAEETGANISLGYFDKIYDRFAPILTYIDSLKVLDTQENKVKADVEKKQDIHILAVDDIETNLEILKMFIAKRYPHATIDLATGGYEAVGMYKTQTYDIIFMDLKMPGLNGFEVLEKLNAIHHLPPVYALTADIYKTTYDKVVQAGFMGLLEKPLQLDLLFETIEKVIHEKNN